MVAMFFKLLIGHALGDFVLQNSAMAMGKNRNRKIEGTVKETLTWPYWLTAHALIGGGIVWHITENILLGVIETMLHWVIDFIKCENWSNFHLDQLLHILCRIIYVLILFS